MSDEQGTVGNGVWKWIAALLLAVMLAGAPSIVQAIKAPSQEEVDFIRERQNIVLQRLAVIDVQIAQNQELLDELLAELREHEQQNQGEKR